ncbi:hypothetical protein IF1G_01322 [Cordyceps javanica]|uniref:Uncharacterized protein n=1 Tax=Cordyceps javanica TaxID=43265 RepID=A0A545VBJ6_9HYPO|nr:hypothetical protein IF1G_01322 [Cordyceps javanica]TQW11216.1 hypothetical protein IF2G_02158 [Cordyceps javanica]
MLAAHRDQENLVHAHQIPAKQQPKTPAPRYPKTPLGRFAKNDENVPTDFAGKIALAGTIKNTLNGQSTRRPAAQKHALATPLETSASKFEVQSDENQANRDEEPECAPPAPTPLPYQSDVLPEGGLTFKTLKKKYLLEGYYENFYNPVDVDGISRLDKAFDDEIQSALDKAVEQNDREFAALDWGLQDAQDTTPLLHGVSRDPGLKLGALGAKVLSPTDQKLHMMSSRRAASALAIHSDRVANRSAIEPSGTTPGEAASRTTIGYSKGRTASSMMRPQHQATKSLTRSLACQTSGSTWDSTITPARPRLSAREQGQLKSAERPPFTSIFYDDDDDDAEPMTLSGPAFESEDDETFELKLDF